MVTQLENFGENKNKIPIIIINNSPARKHIRRGDMIASISSVDIIDKIKDKSTYDNFMKQELGDQEIVSNINNISNTSRSKQWKPSDRIKFANKTLTTDQKLKSLIDEYWIVFSRDDEDIGQVNKKYGTHDIKLTNHTPIRLRAYQTPHAKEQTRNNSELQLFFFLEIQENFLPRRRGEVIVSSNPSVRPFLNSLKSKLQIVNIY
jgi:hypothetical protein